MANSEQNLQRLEKAGVLNSEHFSAQDRQVLGNLSDEEVDVLIRLRSKMGETQAGKEHMRPNFIV